MSPYDIEIFERDVDVIQVGARNMQNFDLLNELGKTTKPIHIKKRIISNYRRMVNVSRIYNGRWK